LGEEKKKTSAFRVNREKISADLVWSRDEEASVGEGVLAAGTPRRAGSSLLFASSFQPQCKDSAIVMYKPRALLTLAVAVGLVLAGCDSGGSGMETPNRETTFQQSFDANTDGWVTGEISG
jgi:hypothetical protein